MASHLNCYVGCCPEAVETQAPARFDAGKPQRPETDDPGAQQRGCLLAEEGIWKRVDEIFRRDDVLGVPAIHGVTRKSRIVAKVFRAGPAVFANAIGMVQPGDPHAHANAKSMGAFAQPSYLSDHLLPSNHG